MAERAKRTWGNESRQTAEVMLAKKKVTLTAFILVAGFFVAWTPYAAVSFYSAFVKPEYISPSAATVAAIFAKISVIFNPTVYFFRSEKFRKTIKELFKPKRKQLRSTLLKEIPKMSEVASSAKDAFLYVISWDCNEKETRV